jgi:hypothetical protein
VLELRVCFHGAYLLVNGMRTSLACAGRRGILEDPLPYRERLSGERGPDEKKIPMRHLASGSFSSLVIRSDQLDIAKVPRLVPDLSVRGRFLERVLTFTRAAGAASGLAPGLAGSAPADPSDSVLSFG